MMTMSTNTTDDKTTRSNKRAEEADLDQEVGVPSSEGAEGPDPCVDESPKEKPASKTDH